MATDRSPHERARAWRDDNAINAAINQARANVASWMVADQLDEPADVCEAWVDRMHDQLRDALDPEERLRAILLLIEPDARARASHLLRQVTR